MARPARIEFPGATYHVMSHGVAGTTTFTDDLDRTRFLDFIRVFVDLGNLIVHAYVLMTSHFHFLLQTPHAGLSRIMQQFLERYTVHFNRRLKRRGHLWQARYKAILVQDGEYFLHCSRYIHLNPVKARCCSAPEDYPWSSYPIYLGRQLNPGWVTLSKTLECFASASDYTSFVLEGMQEELADPFDLATGGLVFGSESFVNHVGTLVRLPQLHEDVPGIRSLTRTIYPSIEAIGAAVREEFPDLSDRQHLRIFAYALRRFTDKSGREIASIIGRSPSAVTHIWRELQTGLSTDPELRRRVELLAQALGKAQHGQTLR
jgi:putative transposase